MTNKYKNHTHIVVAEIALVRSVVEIVLVGDRNGICHLLILVDLYFFFQSFINYLDSVSEWIECARFYQRSAGRWRIGDSAARAPPNTRCHGMANQKRQGLYAYMVLFWNALKNYWDDYMLKPERESFWKEVSDFGDKFFINSFVNTNYFRSQWKNFLPVTKIWNCPKLNDLIRLK